MNITNTEFRAVMATWIVILMIIIGGMRWAAAAPY
jgi:hypothetical protein